MASAAGPALGARLEAFESATFKQLRPGRAQVLSAYAADHLDTSDLAIEMPSGEGKTLLALLIAPPHWSASRTASISIRPQQAPTPARPRTTRS